MRAFASSLRRHVVVGLIVAPAVGALESLWALTRVRALGAEASLVPLLAAAVLVPAGALLGATTAVCAQLLAHAPTQPSRTRAEAAAWGLTLALGLGAIGAGAAGYLRFSTRLQDPTFSAHLAAFFAILGSALLLLLAPLLARVLRAALERTAALPVPVPVRREAARLLPTLALSAIALGFYAFAQRYADLLGPLRALPYAAGLTAVATAAWRHGLPRLLDPPPRARALSLAALLALCVSAVLTSALHRAQAALVSTLGPGLSLAALERLTDVDRDGQSGLFGGRDCAPFDRARSPLASEIPGNGVDEDCSGRDLRAGKQRRGSDVRLSSAPLPAELVKRRNVFLIVIDALRADRIGLGAKRSLTPALDRLAARSVMFTEAFSQSSATRMSFPSFLSGRAPSSLRWRRQSGWVQLERDEGLLAEQFRRHGYDTGLVINAWIYERLTRLRRGYQWIQNTRQVRGRTVSHEEANASSSARAIELVERSLRSEPRKPLFLTVYYEGPHEPYVDHRDRGLPARSPSARDRYDSEVRYVDQEVGHFLDYLAVQPELAKKSVIAVIADHGEEHGEHGGSSHGRTCYRESTHVPLIVHAPGFAPAKVAARVGLTDLAPTLLALVGAPPLEHADGRNLLSATPESYAHYPDERVRCAIFKDDDPKGTLTESVRDGDFLYVEHFGRAPSELYQTRLDRGEHDDLAADASSRGTLRRLQAMVGRLSIAE